MNSRWVRKHAYDRAPAYRQLMFFADRNKTFFDPESFPWAASVEAEWGAVRKELDSFSPARRDSEFPGSLRCAKTPDRRRPVKTFCFMLWQEAEENCSRCPETVRVLQKNSRHEVSNVLNSCTEKASQNTEDCEGCPSLSPRVDYPGTGREFGIRLGKMCGSGRKGRA